MLRVGAAVDAPRQQGVEEVEGAAIFWHGVRRLHLSAYRGMLAVSVRVARTAVCRKQRWHRIIVGYNEIGFYDRHSWPTRAWRLRSPSTVGSAESTTGADATRPSV
jgi:hypothetical protein